MAQATRQLKPGRTLKPGIALKPIGLPEVKVKKIYPVKKKYIA